MVGTWRLHRTLRSLDGHALGRFTGELTVTHDGPHAATSVERGVLVHDGDRLDATRTLRYDLHGDGTATVRFDHGGRFHDLDLRSGRCEVVHPCAADRYAGCTEVHDADRWVQTWHVSGPTKSYTSVTTATRVPDRDGSGAG